MDSTGNERLDLDVVEQMIRDRAPIAFKSIGQLVAELRQLRAFVETTAKIAAASADAANRAREEARLWKALAQARAVVICERADLGEMRFDGRRREVLESVIRPAREALVAAGIDPDAP